MMLLPAYRRLRLRHAGVAAVHERLLWVYRRVHGHALTKKAKQLRRDLKLRILDPIRLRLRAGRDRETMAALLAERGPQARGVIVFPPTVDWYVPLYQRPQHLAVQLARLGYLVIYATTNTYDRVQGFEVLPEQVVLTDRFDLVARAVPGAWLMLHAAHPTLTLAELQDLKGHGLRLVYDYVDDIHPDICGENTLIVERHIQVDDRLIDLALATAPRLHEELQKKLPGTPVLLNRNAVDYDHFRLTREAAPAPDDLQPALASGRPIIGYYGALAKWIDYDLLNYVAAARPEWQFVLIGWDYDGSMSRLMARNNVTFLGVKPYPELPRYSVWFDVGIVPFLEGDIAKSTSPLKLFEYMATNLPVVATRDLLECHGHEGVLIAQDRADFVNQTERALTMANDPAVRAALDRQARANTWSQRARDIADAIERLTPHDAQRVQPHVADAAKL